MPVTTGVISSVMSVNQFRLPGNTPNRIFTSLPVTTSGSACNSQINNFQFSHRNCNQSWWFVMPRINVQRQGLRHQTAFNTVRTVHRGVLRRHHRPSPVGRSISPPSVAPVCHQTSHAHTRLTSHHVSFNNIISSAVSHVIVHVTAAVGLALSECRFKIRLNRSYRRSVLVTVHRPVTTSG